MNIKKLFSIFTLVILVFATACTNKSEKATVSDTNEKPKEEIKIVEPNGAEKAKLNLNFGVGKLNISGNEEKLMKGKFIYSENEWKPEIKYEVKDKDGELEISQPGLKSGNVSLNNKRNEWNINLNEKIPTEIKLSLGTGEFKADLSKINLKELNVGMGVGKVNLDISGNYKNNVKVNIEGGVGEATVYLPKSIGVKIKAEKGVGAVNANGFIVEGENIYKNSQYGKSKNSIEVNIEAGVGAINIKQK
ncbi:hypothetical protein PZQ55_000188 [Clostridium botulinum]|uniref:toast rack family protein n=1 Tax=Clostridium TaxID=1485 RepID=UPI001A932B7F|nr:MULTISPECIES: toast rack family protein [Clostridium]EKO1911178.1 hypothetical protein [Clostridium botulinum]EKO2041239.1 hypothetical protein [Clostridium botulinum]MBO0526368.1 hypothetical protein [Clostridium botulinum]MBO0530183.1 hypothetical protein [Clostridium botulinum]MBO0531440.1 hypothetical protein [Clostridium botulinum]